MGETNSVHEARDFPDRWSVDTFLGFNWCGETPARIGRNDLPPLPHGRGKYTWAQLRDKLSVAELRVCRPMRALLMGGCPLTLIGNSRKSIVYVEYALRQGFRVRTFILLYNDKTRVALLRGLLQDDLIAPDLLRPSRRRGDLFFGMDVFFVHEDDFELVPQLPTPNQKKRVREKMRRARERQPIAIQQQSPDGADDYLMDPSVWNGETELYGTPDTAPDDLLFLMQRWEKAKEKRDDADEVGEPADEKAKMAWQRSKTGDKELFFAYDEDGRRITEGGPYDFERGQSMQAGPNFGLGSKAPNVPLRVGVSAAVPKAGGVLLAGGGRAEWFLQDGEQLPFDGALSSGLGDTAGTVGWEADRSASNISLISGAGEQSRSAMAKLAGVAGSAGGPETVPENSELSGQYYLEGSLSSKFFAPRPGSALRPGTASWRRTTCWPCG